MTTYYTQAQLDSIGILIANKIASNGEELKQFVQDKINELEPVAPPAPTEPEAGGGAAGKRTALSLFMLDPIAMIDKTYMLPAGNHFFTCNARGAGETIDLQLSLDNFHPVSGECVFEITPLSAGNPKSGISYLNLNFEGSKEFVLNPSIFTTISLKLINFDGEYFFASTVVEKVMVIEEV